MSAHPKWTFVSEMVRSRIDRRDVAKPAIHLSRRSCRSQSRVTCPPPTSIRSGHLKLRPIPCATEFQMLTYSLRVKLLEFIKFQRLTRVFFFFLWLWNMSYQNPERSWRGVLCTLWRHVMPCLWIQLTEQLQNSRKIHIDLNSSRGNCFTDGKHLS